MVIIKIWEKFDLRLCWKWTFWVKCLPVGKKTNHAGGRTKILHTVSNDPLPLVKTSSRKLKKFLNSGGGPCIFYRPVCKVPSTITYVWQINLQETTSSKFTKPIIQYVISTKFTFWSVKYKQDGQIETLYIISV